MGYDTGIIVRADRSLSHPMIIWRFDSGVDNDKVGVIKWQRLWRSQRELIK